MIAEYVKKLIARPIAASKTASRAAAATTLSVCETLLTACKSTLAADVRRIKESLIQGNEAEARKKLAEAMDAANKVTRRSHHDDLARLERERLEIENRKTAAEAAEAEAKAAEAGTKVDRAKIENARARMEGHREFLKMVEETRKANLSEKEQRLFDALAQLQREGGTFYVDPAELKKLIDWSKGRE